MKADRYCENCAFGEFYGEKYEGNCRRYAPRPSKIEWDGDEPITQYPQWPRVDGGDWCGEWKPQDKYRPMYELGTI